jgi:hypothetical protein
VADDEVENSFVGFWKWYAAISFLAENKVWQVDHVTNIPLMAALNHLSFLMDLNKEKEKQMKEANK